MKEKKKNIFFHKYLLLEKITLDQQEIDFQLDTHPEYPSLLSYHDALNFFMINNIVVNIEDRDTTNLPNQFIAEILIENTESKLALIQKINSEFVIFIDNDTKLNVSQKDFIDMWTGVVLVAESSDKKIKKKHKNRIFLVSLCTIILASIAFFSLSSFAFSILILTGIFLASESLKQEFDIQTSFSDKFCNLSTNTDCNSIINSNNFKLFNYLGLNDISLIFFLGQLLSLVIFSILGLEKKYYDITSNILLFTIPISLASIYYQWRIMKKWCAICLFIIVVLFFQIVFSLLNSNNFSFFKLNLLSLESISYGIILFSILCSWVLVKPSIKEFFKLKSENKNLFKFKRNYNLFKYSLTSSKKKKIDLLSSDIYLGEREANFKLSLVTNPLCKFCKETHFIIEKLLDKYKGSIRIDISFYFELSNTEISDTGNLHLKLIDIYFNQDKRKFLQSLSDWFNNKDYDKWFDKYGKQISNQKEYIEILNNQYKRNMKNDVIFTPTLFLGEYSYPQIYDNEDILLYMDDLLEDNEILIKNI